MSEIELAEPVESLEKALAECRDVFPIPESGAPDEQAWAAAMGDPSSVPEYVRASLRAAVLAERTRCLGVVEAFACGCDRVPDIAAAVRACAAAIRAG